MSQPLWEPSPERIAAARLTAFIARVNEQWGQQIGGYTDLYEWSIDEIDKFWTSVWDFGDVVAETRGEEALVDGDKMPGARFFPKARLSYAENLLRYRGDDDAIVFRGEDVVRRRLSRDELYDKVSRLAQALRGMGVEPGDRVGGFLPNLPEAIIAFLATAAVGGTWSSCSPDFGVQGVVDRFGQIEPKVLFCADGYFFKGKAIDSLDRVGRFLAELPSVQHVVVAPYVNGRPDLDPLRAALHGSADSPKPRVDVLDDVYAAHPATEIDFVQLPFDHPIYILFSSGTTGKPKCIVHGGGGALVKHLYEHQLMCDVGEGDRVFYFTTCGWMMWNWLVTGLASGATLLLYDGNPMHPDGNVLFDFAQEERMTLFGTSAKFIDALRNLGIDPKNTHDLSALRTLTSTGSPLAPSGFDYVYEHIKDDLCLSSIAGGTDIVGCFVGGNPIGPVWRNEIQVRCLGMAVDVFDDEGNSLRGEQGELVCKRPFPSMPVRFWNDPDGARYKAAYFERYDNIWWHGDFVELTEHDGIVMLGRSDATLNPGGVRIGTAEIYRIVEKLPEVEEGLVIGQDWDNDVRVVLFVRLAEGATLDDELAAHIRSVIRTGASPRHVPAKILEVADIPRTKSGKITELAVRDVVHGRPVKNKEALANPEALELFANRPELRS